MIITKNGKPLGVINMKCKYCQRDMEEDEGLEDCDKNPSGFCIPHIEE